MNPTDRTFIVIAASQFPAEQSDGDSLVYSIDYSSALQAATVSASTWEAPGVTVANEARVANVVSARLTGSPGRYTVKNIVTTSTGDTLQRVIRLTITGDDAAGDYE